MLKKLMPMLWVGFFVSAQVSFASDSAFRAKLVEEINQIDAAVYVAQQARDLQGEASNTVFHFELWHDDNGVIHQGLIDDLKTIRRGISQYLQPDSLDTPNLAPIKGDYVKKVSL